MSLLEPYILNDRLTELTPTVMKAFVHQCNVTQSLETVERCLLHADLKALEVDEAVRLCQKHRMITALVNILNRGRLDYTTPIDLLLTALVREPNPAAAQLDVDELVAVAVVADSPRDRADSGASVSAAGVTAASEADRRHIGGMLLLYIHSCLTGREFPRGDVPPERRGRLCATVLAFLFDKDAAEFTALARGSARDREYCVVVPGPYPRLQALCHFDVDATISVLRALLSDAAVTSDVPAGVVDAAGIAAPGVSALVAALADAVLPFGEREGGRRGCADGGRFVRFPASVAAAVFRLIADVVSRPASRVSVDPEVMQRVLAHLARPADGDDVGAVERQATLVKLLQRISLGRAATKALLKRVEAAGFYRAAVVLHTQAGAFDRVVTAYIKDDDPQFQRQVFDYIKDFLELARTRSFVASSGGVMEDALPPQLALDAPDIVILKKIILPELPRLINIDQETTSHLIVELFPNEPDTVLAHLDSFPESQFRYLDRIMAGVERSTEGGGGGAGGGGGGGARDARMADLLRRYGMRVSEKMHLAYIDLLCRLYPKRVYDYVSTHDSYPLQATLNLILQSNILDATAYLKERTGDVGGALALLLSGMNELLEKLTLALRDTAKGGATSVRHSGSTVVSVPPLEGKCSAARERVEEVLECAVRMCQRNSESLLRARGVGGGVGGGGGGAGGGPGGGVAGVVASDRDDRGEMQWFKVLDALVNKPTDGRAARDPTDVESAVRQAVLSEVNAFRSSLVRHVLDSMKAHVPLNRVLKKIMDDHAAAAFGEFKGTILGMLDTYGYEQRILTTAKSVMSHDMFKQVEKLHVGKAAGVPARRHYCSSCDSLLAAQPAAAQAMLARGAARRRVRAVVVFACEHAYHSACLDTPSSCPLCTQHSGDRGAGSTPARARGVSLSARGRRARGSSAGDGAAGFGSPAAASRDGGEVGGDSDSEEGGGGSEAGVDADVDVRLAEERGERTPARPARPPLTELYELLGRADTRVDVRTTKLHLAPTAKGAKISRAKYAQISTKEALTGALPVEEAFD